MLQEQFRNAKLAENFWIEMISRSLPWNPWSTMGMGNGCPQCPCCVNSNSQSAPPPPPLLYGNPSYGYNSQYRFPESYLPNVPPPPYYHNQPVEFYAQPQIVTDSVQAQTVPNLVRSYPQYVQQPYALATTSNYPYQQTTPTEDSVQQQGIVQAIRSRLKSELAAVAAKINPVEQPQQSTTQQATPAQSAQPARQPSMTQRSSTSQQPTTTQARPPTSQQPATAQQARSTKSNLWQLVTTGSSH